MGVRMDCSTGQQTTIPDFQPAHNPVLVTNLQFRKAVRASGRAAAFKTYFQSLTETEQEDWQFAKFIRRNSAMVAALQTALGVTSNQIDALFRAALDFDE